jgi:hypothetical protein
LLSLFLYSISLFKKYFFNTLPFKVFELLVFLSLVSSSLIYFELELVLLISGTETDIEWELKG